MGVLSVIKFLGRLISYVFLLLLFIVIVRTALESRVVSAGTDIYYPKFCLGGWRSPALASGRADVSAEVAPSYFNDSNSAFLEGPVAAQIFCGYFEVAPREEPPISAKVSFIWNIDFPRGETPIKSESFSSQSGYLIAPSTGIKVVDPVLPIETEPATTTQSGEPAPTSSEEKKPEPKPRTPNPEPTEPVPTPIEESPAPANTESVNTPTLESVPPPPPAETPPPPPAETPPPLPPSAPESMRNEKIKFAGVLQAVKNFLSVPTANAAEKEINQKSSPFDFLEITYSLDGVRWIALERINRYNWYKLSVSIPVKSWEDLENLQIMVSALPSLETKPNIYLEAIELEVESNLTVRESTADSVKALTEAASKLADILDISRDSALAAVTEALSTSVSYSSTEDAPTPENRVPESTPAIEEPALPPPPHKEKRLKYEYAGDSIAAKRVLPWYPENLKEELADSKGKLSTPNVTLGKDGLSLRVKGSCTLPYFVVLTYRDPDDYILRPARFTSNYAGPCVDGNFNYDMEHLPLDTVSGTYYLLVAGQGEEGPWIPSSYILPIKIGATEVTVDKDGKAVLTENNP